MKLHTYTLFINGEEWGHEPGTNHLDALFNLLASEADGTYLDFYANTLEAKSSRKTYTYTDVEYYHDYHELKAAGKTVKMFPFEKPED